MAWGAAGKLPAALEALPLADGHGRALAAWLSRLVALKQAARFVVVDLPPNLDATMTAAPQPGDTQSFSVRDAGVHANVQPRLRAGAVIAVAGRPSPHDRARLPLRLE